MSKTSHTDEADCIESTDVYHDGDEVAVRARSKHSRVAHIPKTDDGDVVFDDDDQPVPKCGLPSGDPDAIDFILTPVGSVDRRDACSYCTDTNGDPAKGAANKSFARRMRYGESWGEE